MFNQIEIYCKKNKKFDNILNEIKNERIKLLNFCCLDEYKNIINEHITILCNILKYKNIQSQNSNKFILLFLNNIDMYIIKYNNFFNYSLDENREHINLYIDCLKWSNRRKDIYPYSSSEFTNKFLNYTLCLYKIDECISLFLHNSKSIIFLNNKDNNYMFYTLSNIDENNNYYWKIDNRLIDFSSDIQENLLSYMILMFREIHQHIFLNDKFNKNYKLYNKGFINFEYEMLLYNLFTVFDLIKLSTLFTSFIKKYNKHKASINDYFDTFDDDLTIKDMIENKEDICIYTICRKLFYDITVKDAADLYKNIINKFDCDGV